VIAAARETTDQAVKFRRFHRDDVDAVLALFKHTQGASRSREQWYWEFDEGPGGPSLGWVAESKGEIVAHWAVIPLPLVCDGRTEMGGKGELAIVHPLFRGRAVFPRLMRGALADLDRSSLAVTWSFPNELLWKVQEWAGYRVAGKLRYLLAIRNPAAFAAAVTRWPALRVAARALRPADAIAARLLPIYTRRRRTSIVVETQDSLDERFEQAALQTTRTGGPTLVRNLGFLRWRFERNPTQRYRYVLACSSSGQPLGFAIYTHRQWRHVRLGEIVDFAAPIDDVSVREALLSTVIHSLAERDVDAIRFMLSPGNALAAQTAIVARRQGFWIDVAGARFSTRMLAAQNASQFAFGDWYVTASFTEGIHY
jgi:hypothetical protein